MNHRVISTRRQIVTEQDRYGGYQTDFSGERPDKPEDDVYAEFRLSREERGLDRTDYGYMDWSQTDFATRPDVENDPVGYSKRAKLTEYVGVDTAREAPKPKKRHNPDDVMPSIKTRSYTEAEQTPTRLSGSVKTMLAIYIAAVIALSVIVIAIGISITSAQSRLTFLEADLAGRAQTVAEQEAELGKFNDLAYLEGLAAENGMERIGSYQEVRLIAAYEPETYETEANWFDRFCSWLNGFFH